MTREEKNIVRRLNHSLYNVKYLEEWVDRNDNVFTNAPAALQAMGAKGFYDAVRCIAQGTNIWIPVGERLPGTERILITDGEIVKEGYRRPDGVWKYGVKEDELFSSLSSVPVIAWMPLPKPFNPQN